jgi:type II secretory pathway component PulF
MKFRVKYLDPQGRPQQEELEFADRDQALAHCRSQRFTVLDLAILEQVEKKETLRRGWEPFGIRPATLAFFTRQLAELTEAGIPLVQTLETLRKYSSSGRLQDVISILIRDISAGKGFAASLREHPNVFSKIYVNTVEVGERSGNLTVMLAKVADYLERDEEIRSKIQTALTYPGFIIGFCLFLTYAMVSFILPGFTPLFQESGLDLHRYPITMFLIELSKWTTSFWDEVLLAGLIAALIWTYRWALATRMGKGLQDRLLYHLPVIGDFVQLAVQARICNTIAILQEAGLPIYQALATAADVSGNSIMEEALKAAQVEIESGKSLSVALNHQEQGFPPLMIQMVSVGEQTGDVPKMLGRIARYYEGQLNNAIKGFSSLIEPMIMVVVGGLVSFFVLGVFMPIMGIVAALQAKL